MEIFLTMQPEFMKQIMSQGLAFQAGIDALLIKSVCGSHLIIWGMSLKVNQDRTSSIK